MTIRVFEGKLGREHGIGQITEEMQEYFDYALPAKGDLVGLGDEVYVVKQVLMDYNNDPTEGREPEYSIFVKKYDWE